MKFYTYFNDDNSIAFNVFVELQTTDPKEMNISEVFNLANISNSEFGRSILSNDIPDGLKKMLSSISWGIRTYICYQDIFDSGLGSYEEDIDDVELFVRQICDFNRNYCYFESLTYLKEAIICLLNGNLLATMVLLRPFLELAIAEIYWNLKSYKKSSSQFYRWLLGDIRFKQGFTNMLDYFYSNCDALSLLDKSGLQNNKKDLKRIYKKLCSYNHTPILNESITSHAGNTGVKDHRFLSNLICLINEMLFHVNLIYLIKYPMTLFPQDIYRRFGYYNGPVGLFFDEFNYSILKRYFGAEETLMLKKSFEDYSIKKDLINFLNSYSILTDDEMEESWKEAVSNVFKKEDYYKITDHAVRVTLCKTHFRAFRISSSYIRDIDLERFNHDFQL